MELPKEFKVQIVFNNDIINELDAERPSEEMISQLSQQNTFKLKASMFFEKRKPGRPPKQKVVVEESISEEEEIEDVPDDEMMEIENNLSISSGRDKKFTKRQLHSMGNLDFNEPLLQLPQNKCKSKKDLAYTEEEMLIKSMKEIQRKEKLQRQQEEFKSQMVHKLLNEAGRKQKQRQAEEDKKQEKFHKYKALPCNDLIIKYKSTSEGTIISMPHIVGDLFAYTEIRRNVKPNCSMCTTQSKYRIPNTDKYACSLQCYKLLV